MKRRQQPSSSLRDAGSVYAQFRNANPKSVDRVQEPGVETQIRAPESQSETSQQEPTETADKLARLEFEQLRPILMIPSGLFLVALLLYGLALHFGEPISLAGHSLSQKQHEIVIANSVLKIPANVIRYHSQRRDGNQSRTELYFHWPSLSGYSAELQAEFNEAANHRNLLFVTLEPRILSLEMSGRIGPIYSKFLTGPAEPSVAGLLRQALSPEGGYIDEDLYFEANSPYPFAARCIRPDSVISTPFCMRDIHIGTDLMLTYRFHSDQLEHWLKIETALRKHIKTMIIHQG